MEDREQKGIILGGSDPDCSSDQRNVNNFVPMSDEEFLDSLPPGYRFEPTDDELIIKYLSKKIKDMPLPPNRIRVIKLYDFHPGYLFENYKPKREKELYFFTVREKKYENGHRPNRVTGDGNGYWRSSQTEKPIFSSANGRKVGYRRSLVFHEFGASGESKRGVKTPWLMHEYRIGDNLDEWVVCKIYKGPKKEDRVPQPTDDVTNEAHNRAIQSPLASSEMVICNDDGPICNQIESHTSNSGSMLAPLPTSMGPMMAPPGAFDVTDPGCTLAPLSTSLGPMPASLEASVAIDPGHTLAPLGAFDATDPRCTLAPLPTSLGPMPASLEAFGAIDPGPTLAPLPDSLNVQSYERVQLDDVIIQNILDWYHANGAAGLAAYDQSLYYSTTL